MLNLAFALFLIFGILWIAKKFYFPVQMAQHPERYPIEGKTKISQKDLPVILSHIQRWRREGKLSREEYDHLTDLCLSEMENSPQKE